MAKCEECKIGAVITGGIVFFIVLGVFFMIFGEYIHYAALYLF